MKDSGIEWVGEIPFDWEIVKTARTFTFGRGLSISKENMSNEGIPCVHYADIHVRYGFEVNPEKDVLLCIDESYQKTAPQALLKYGDYLFAGTSEDTEGSGNFTYINSDVPVFAGSDTIILRAKREINYRYVAYMFDSLAFREQIRSQVCGIKVFHPSQRIIKGAKLLLPLLPEQQAIADYLDNKCAEIDAIVAAKKSQLETLDAYKKSLIYEYVTGKVDVPGYEMI
jgi:type I restriction enzyme S subunit